MVQGVRIETQEQEFTNNSLYEFFELKRWVVLAGIRGRVP